MVCLVVVAESNFGGCQDNFKIDYCDVINFAVSQTRLLLTSVFLL